MMMPGPSEILIQRGTALLSAEETLSPDTSRFEHNSGFTEGGTDDEMETSEPGMLIWAHRTKGQLDPPYDFVLDFTADRHMTSVGPLFVLAGDYRKKLDLEMMGNRFTAYALGSIQHQHENKNFSIPRVHHVLRDPAEEGDKKLVTVSRNQLFREHHVEMLTRQTNFTIRKIGSNDEVGHGRCLPDGRHVLDDLRLPLQNFVLDFQSTFHLAAKRHLFVDAEHTTLPAPEPRLASLGNGMMLSVDLVGHGRIQTEDGLFNLSSVLHVKGIPRDLVCVSWHQLEKDHHLEIRHSTTQDHRFTIVDGSNNEVGGGWKVVDASSISYRLDRLSVPVVAALPVVAA